MPAADALADVRIESGLEGRLDRSGQPLRLTNGFLPFQWEGVRFIAEQERAAYVRWDTGTGKTVAAEAAILMKRAEGYDLTLYVVRPNHLEGARRKLLAHTGIEGRVLRGGLRWKNARGEWRPGPRAKTYLAVDDDVAEGRQPVLIMNPEKFSTDREYLSELVAGRSVLLILDEAQKRFGNRATNLYRDACAVLYTSCTDRDVHYPRAGYERPSRLFGIAMSATPITRSPENLFNTVRLICPGLLGSVSDFNNAYAGPRNPWGEVIYWKNLEHLAEAVSPIVHQASKRDPEIAAQFPVEMPPEVAFCEMDAPTERLYRALQGEYANIGEASLLSFDEVLAAIGCLQMIVSNPRAVLHSAREREAYETELWAFVDWLEDEGVPEKEQMQNLREFERLYRRGSEVALKLRDLVKDDSLFTDTDAKGVLTNGKLIGLKEYLEEHDGKAVVFTSEVVMQGLVSEWLDAWGVGHVVYNGALTSAQAQAAIDRFRSDPGVLVFLSTDAGQDSIDLPEASLTVHYDLPRDWAWSSKTQRQNRQHRIDSEQESVRTVELTVPGTVEDRKAEVVERKHGYHVALFEGGPGDAGEEEAGQDDYLYVLTGQRAE